MRGSDVNTATGAALWQPSRPAELFKSSGTSARAVRDRRLAPAHRFFYLLRQNPSFRNPFGSDFYSRRVVILGSNEAQNHENWGE